ADAEVVRDSDIGLLMVRHEAPDDTTYTGRTSFGIFADQYDIESSTVILSVPEVQVTATANVEFCYDEPI
ncbi:hypothetical protein KY359_03245, partial [Candidatus Woesearchaeota archaeon]|nr:hypothetical protein [Candidatus Woesearchaeota archaeon]